MKRLLFLLWLSSSILMANDVRLENLAQTAPDQLTLEVGWRNSWRFPPDSSSGNHDALWLFCKYQDAQGRWHPLALSLDSNAHRIEHPELEVRPSSDGLGLWLRRSRPGTGDLALSAFELTLATPLPTDAQAVSAFALEMVHVPTAPYWLGDSSSFHHFRQADTGAPYRVDSEQAIDDGNLSSGDEARLGGSLPAAYPKGYAGLYVMKHELSQAAYRDFLNCLSYTQQAARTRRPPHAPPGTYALAPAGAPPARNGLIVAEPGVPSQRPAHYACDAQPDGLLDQRDDGQTRACNHLAWDDLLAYLDWAGLRPLSELEYEKACRGPAYPMAGEFAWGSARAIDANTLRQDGTPQETVAEQATARAGLASHGYLGPAGPLRVGFGGRDSSGRLQLGGSYYGLTEMSGNLWEICVGVRAASLGFIDQPGKGQLSPNGQADVPAWPSADGAIYRGGAFNSGIFGPYRDLAVSDRFYYDLAPNQRRATSGGRGGRRE